MTVERSQTRRSKKLFPKLLWEISNYVFDVEDCNELYENKTVQATAFFKIDQVHSSMEGQDAIECDKLYWITRLNSKLKICYP